jgi:hypothetical protein
MKLTKLPRFARGLLNPELATILKKNWAEIGLSKKIQDNLLHIKDDDAQYVFIFLVFVRTNLEGYVLKQGWKSRCCVFHSLVPPRQLGQRLSFCG